MTTTVRIDWPAGHQTCLQSNMFGTYLNNVRRCIPPPRTIQAIVTAFQEEWRQIPHQQIARVIQVCDVGARPISPLMETLMLLKGFLEINIFFRCRYLEGFLLHVDSVIFFTKGISTPNLWKMSLTPRFNNAILQWYY